MSADLVELAPRAVPEGQAPQAAWTRRRFDLAVVSDRSSCVCGKRDVAAHGGLTCRQVLETRARVAAAAAAAWRRYLLPAVGVLAGVAGAVLLVWAVVLGVTAVVSAVNAAAAWLADSWPGLAVVALALALLFAGRAKCGGLHCGGCKR